MADRHFDVAIMQPGYLPWLGYFDLVAMSDTFVIYDDVQFDKRSWRNRNRIFNSPEPVMLTVPVLTKDRRFQLVRETEVIDNGWQRKHLNSLRHAYHRAPYFDWCYPPLEKLLIERNYRWLIDLCLEGHRVLSGLLGIGTPLRLSSEIGFGGIGRTERLVAICSALGASRYISPDASKDYMVETLWTDAGIELVYQNYPHPVYRQYGDPLQSHLSVVDALMFVGPEARAFVGISHSKSR